MRVSTDPMMPMEAPRMRKACRSAVIPKECAQGSMEMHRLFSFRFVNQASPALTFSARLPWERRTPLGSPVVPEV